MTRYDTIGRGYRARRRPDARLAGAILDALADARTVLNVGAGAGSYEPIDRRVVALEPSVVMIAQRSGDAAPVVRACAERLPFADRAFDACLATLTLHHWSDLGAGLAEMARVARRRIVILTWDPDEQGFWLVRDYFPDIAERDYRICPALADLQVALGRARVTPMPIPHDCTDGFLGAYWRRPEAYLDAEVRAAISAFSFAADVGPRIERLARDLADGTWAMRNAGIRGLSSLDMGYRLLTFELGQ